MNNYNPQTITVLNKKKEYVLNIRKSLILSANTVTLRDLKVHPGGI